MAALCRLLPRLGKPASWLGVFLKPALSNGAAFHMGLTEGGQGAITRASDFAARHNPSNWNTLSMAQHKSAEKRARQTIKRTEVNRSRRTKVRGAVKQVELAIASGDKTAAAAAFKLAQPALDKSVTKGVVKKGTASRKLSRLNAAIKTMA